jgi:DNA repair protein RecO (recombination protein O)
VGAIVTRAIVLRSAAYGEADRVVTLLGRQTGRISALARGARKSVRRFGGGLGLAATGDATLRDRAGAELAVLEGFEAVEPRVGLGADLGRMAHAGYVAELCDKLCAPRQPELAVFDWLEPFLGLLESRGARAERLRVFELGLLGRLGLGPSWQACVACGRSDLGTEMVRLQPARGGFVCDGCGRQGTPLHPEVRGCLLRLSRLPLEGSEGETLDRDLNAACRRAILELLAVHLPGPLKSVEFMAKLGAG